MADKTNRPESSLLPYSTIEAASSGKRYLKAGVIENGLRIKTTEGSPQGGPLSPLLANIYLNE